MTDIMIIASEAVNVPFPADDGASSCPVRGVLGDMRTNAAMAMLAIPHTLLQLLTSESGTDQRSAPPR